MRAARYYDQEDIRIEEVPDPVPGRGEVLIRVAYNGICGTDVHEYYSGPAWVPTNAHPRTGVSRPVILGHEFSGTVEAIGEGAQNVAVGDRVCVETVYPCESCERCTAGMPNLCTTFAVHGLSGPGGGLSELTVVKDSMVHRLPDNVSLELGALVEPMAVTTHAISRAEVVRESSVVIFGAGPIGIGTFLGLRARGVTSIVVVEPSPQRRDAIARLGATVIIDPSGGDINERVRAHTGGDGADVAFECAGVAASLADACSSVRARGKVVIVATYETDPPLPATTLLLNEIEVVGCLAYAGKDFPETIALMAKGGYDVTGWVSHIDLEDLIGSGIEALRAGRAMKILVDLARG